MEMDWAQQPLTRGEFLEFTGITNERLDSFGGSFDRALAELVRMRTEMVTKAELKRLEGKIDKLYVAVLDIAEKGKVYDTKALTHADQLFGHEARLGDHEKRIKRLESGEH